MIENIKIKNFKSLADVDLNLRSLNVLIGRNGSGKSNFLNFFRLLREGANARLNEAINDMGGYPHVLRYESQLPLSWEMTFKSSLKEESTLYYSGELIGRGLYGYRIEREELESPPRLGYANRYKYVSVFQGRVRIHPKGGAEEAHTEDTDQELTISQFQSVGRDPTLAGFRNLLSDWQLFQGFGHEDLKRARGPQPFNVQNPLRLRSTGDNLVSIIQEVANNRRYDNVNERLINAMRAAFPDFLGLYTPTVAGGMGALAYGDAHIAESIPASNMSDGQIRFLGVLISLLLAHTANPPSLIAIDEPEIGMHPDMIAIFAEHLRSASQKTQVIITTHSPQLIDELIKDASHLEDIVVVEREEGKTTLKHLDVDRLSRWLERYTAGKLWVMGKLGA